jgi:nitrite reductase/ring-hydroxylating ferredoxin subunit
VTAAERSGGEDAVQLGDLSGLGDGQVHLCEAFGKDVMVCRVRGQLYALEDECSHASTTLSDGRLSGYVVTCALHGAQFDVRDGRHLGPPAWTGVETFVVLEDGDRATLARQPREDPGTAAPPGTPPPGGFLTR